MILQGDALTQLKTLPEQSVNMCMTSPPYWALRDYGTASWEGGNEDCDHLNGTLQSMKTTLHPGTNQNDKRNFSGMPYKEICGKCGAKRVDKQLGLEPTFDKYISNLCDIFDEVKRVLRNDGTCWVNIGDSYGGSGNASGHKEDTKNLGHTTSKMGATKGITSGIMPKSLVGIPFRFALEMINRGWILRNTIIWHKPNCMPSSVKDRFTVDFEYVFLFSKKKKYYFETQYEPVKNISLKRVKYGLNQTDHKGKAVNVQNLDKMGDRFCNEKGRNKRTVWRICPKPFKEAHFAVFPEELCETPIKAGCLEGGTVLDPFFGAGTTGLVALKQNKKFIGIELNPEYIEIAKKRLRPFIEQKPLICSFCETKQPNPTRKT